MSRSSGHEINVTPLIDVLLVLLVIFLVSIPILLRMQTVDLPPSEPDVAPTGTPVVLRLYADLTVTIDDGAPIARSDLPAALRKKADPSTPVFVDVDDSIPWAEVISLVDTVHGSTDGARTAIRLREAPGGNGE
jgi:biopolymer transport protein ExbD